MSSTNPSPQESSSDNDLNDLLALLGSESESPSSTIPSIEDSLVQQLDSFEEVNEQQKTTLPPCQVCGGPSSGFHYGANTCEGCKVFFRRSKEKFGTYVCITQRNHCFPGENYLFPCKRCRYNKCLYVGMSRANAKIGRYTKERHQENKKQIADIELRRAAVPYLSIYSDSQDIFIMCYQSFGDLPVDNWNLEVDNFNEIFTKAMGSMTQGIYTKQEYMDIYEVTGIEIDQRNNYAELIELFIQVLFTRAIKCLRRLPGLDRLSDIDFYKNVLQHRENLCVLVEVATKANWTNTGLAFQLGRQRSVTLPSEYMAKMTDSSIAESQMRRGMKLTEVDLKYEEAIFLTAIFMFTPTKDHPQFQDFHQRLMLAFTKYLEENYGKNYHLRLQQLISAISFFKEENLQQRKWLQKNEVYFKKLYKTEMLKAFALIDDLDKGAEILKGLKI